ncbi:hypothetical protein [Stutzerimonas nitrititolerans]|uniref:hypothetical protein n=1 Tax=Stutzerimonas nitrititolerans TaxID=2482751 RepID=UPI0015E338B6|nr:hypothetical protein [Stutzerimonas nitrititolerans]MBA1183783.1 hypothetical protein [Stutzerimonas stutzeri]
MTNQNRLLNSLKLTPIKILLVLLPVFLNGCVMIPYETPEARKKIQNDLNISSESIIDITEINWCSYYYGDAPDCKVTQGLGVLTTNGLLLSLYKSKKYIHSLTLTADNIKCTHTLTSASTPEVFYAFTASQAFMLAPITPRGQMNIPVKEKIYIFLNSKQSEKLTGNNVAFIEKTDKKQYGGSMIMVGTTPVPYGTSSDVYKIISPCKA